MNGRFFFAALFALSSWGQGAADQPLQARLSTASGSYSLRGGGLLRGLVQVAGDFHLPMGIEWIKPIGARDPIMLSWQDATASTVLHDLVSAYSTGLPGWERAGYEVEVGNGVVHVFPKALRGNKADVLNARIGTFEVKDQPVKVAAYSSLAERVAEIMEPGLRHGWWRSLLFGGDEGFVTFRIDNATVRDALDKLCLSDILNVWVVAYPADPVSTRGGFFKTIPPFGSAQPRDDSDGHFIPRWEFLRWGIWPGTYRD